MLFIAVPIPDHVATILETTAISFGAHLDQHIPREKWHITLVWLGDTDDVASWLPTLTKPLSQTFLPTISLRYVGRGKQPKQLWAYVQITPALVTLRQELITRLHHVGVAVPHLSRPWVPHIHVADFSAHQDGVLADRLLPATTFVPTAAYFLRDYIVEGTVVFS